MAPMLIFIIMMRRIVLLLLMAASLTAITQKPANFKGRMVNDEYQVYINIDFYRQRIVVPGQEILGQLAGYLGDECDGRKWLFTEAKVETDAKATIAVMVLYYAVAQWNGWFDAMIYLQDRSKFPLQLFLREILLININNANNAAGNDAADVLYLDTLVKYAMIIISTVPILCIYPFVQKYFMKGVMMGSIKE